MREAASSNLGMCSLAHVDCFGGKADAVNAVVSNDRDPGSHFKISLVPSSEAWFSLFSALIVD